MENEGIKKQTIDGVDIVDDGTTIHFSISEEAKREDELKRKQELERREEEEMTWFDKVCNWFKSGMVRPCVKVRDLADPFGDRHRDPDDMDVGRDGAIGIEAGIKVNF